MAADDKRGGGLYDVEPRRSIFAALWFRVILVLIVVGVIGALAVPYVLDVVNPPGVKPAVVPKPAAPAVATPAPPPALAPTPVQAPAPAAPAPRSHAVAPAPTPAPAAQPATTEEKQVERPTTTKPAKPTARRVARAAPTPVALARGAYWVQVGAFKDLESAKRLAARLRDQNYSVEESSTGAPTRQNPGSTPAPPLPGGDAGADKYDVFVGGAALAAVTAKLSAKGLTTEPGRDGIVVRPSLPLRAG